MSIRFPKTCKTKARRKDRMKKPTLKQLKKKVPGELSFCLFVGPRKARCIGIRKGDKRIAAISDHPCGEVALSVMSDICLAASTLAMIYPFVNRVNFEAVWKEHWKAPTAPVP